MTTPPKSLVRRTPWPNSTSTPVGTPIQPSVVYGFSNPDAIDAQYEAKSGYAYAREGHPNADVLARKIDGMEGATGGIITGSGMAAIGAAMLGALKAGDHVVAGNQLYGRSLRMLTTDLPRFGIKATFADPTDIEAIKAAIHPQTRLILVEVVSNPTLRVADMQGIARIANERGILLMVDNTFTTPLGFSPFEHGADIVIHSVTKMLAGHSDVTLGYVATHDTDLREEIKQAAATWGMTGSPFDCWLAERGLYSFELRYGRAEENAATLADHLAGLKGVKRVIYPTRPDHPDHNRAVALLSGRGGHMVSFEIDGGRSAANALTQAAPDIAFAPTLGDIGTTLSHPVSTSHRQLTPEAHAELSISEGFFRISVGVEDIELLKEEFSTAIKAAT